MRMASSGLVGEEVAAGFASVGLAGSAMVATLGSVATFGAGDWVVSGGAAGVGSGCDVDGVCGQNNHANVNAIRATATPTVGFHKAGICRVGGKADGSVAEAL